MPELKVPISAGEIIEAVKRMKKRTEMLSLRIYLPLPLLITCKAYVRQEKSIKRAKQNRIGKALLKLQANPLLYSDKLRDPSIGTYRFRIGDYRVIFDIEGNDIVVLRIGHRKEIYKRLQ